MGQTPHLRFKERSMEYKWDIRFLQLAKLVSTWSKIPSTQVGACIVRPDKSVCAVGFNGFAKSMNDDASLYSNRETKYSRIIHGEINALLFAREPVQGYTLYTWPFLPCDRCCVQMLQAGIIRFVAPALEGDAVKRWQESLDRTKSYISEANAEWIEYKEEINNASSRI